MFTPQMYCYCDMLACKSPSFNSVISPILSSSCTLAHNYKASTRFFQLVPSLAWFLATLHVCHPISFLTFCIVFPHMILGLPTFFSFWLPSDCWHAMVTLIPSLYVAYSVPSSFLYPTYSLGLSNVVKFFNWDHVTPKHLHNSF